MTWSLVQLNLSGQREVIFGATKGIGRAIADGFRAEACEVRGFDREPDVSSSAGATDLFIGDVTSYPQVQNFIEPMPRIDHVVFCVGVGSGKFGFPFWNLEPSDWARVLEINLIGAVNVAHACAPKLITRRGGSILFLVSVAGQVGSQTDPPYSAAKAGLINFMQCVAKDLAPYGGRANALSPGMVRTELNQSVWAAGQRVRPPSERQSYADWASEKIRKISPLGEWQTPPEFAAMAVYLASEHAKNITGQTLNIDGGQVMHS